MSLAELVVIVLKIVVLLGFFLNMAAVAIWAERRQSAMVQDRVGPNRAVFYLPSWAVRLIVLLPPTFLGALAALPAVPSLPAYAAVQLPYAFQILTIDAQVAVLVGWVSLALLAGVVRRSGALNAFEGWFVDVDPRTVFFAGVALHAIAFALTSAIPGASVVSAARGVGVALAALLFLAGIYTASRVPDGPIPIRLAGLVHSVADVIKLLMKEDFVPEERRPPDALHRPHDRALPRVRDHGRDPLRLEPLHPGRPPPPALVRRPRPRGPGDDEPPVAVQRAHGGPPDRRPQRRHPLPVRHGRHRRGRRRARGLGQRQQVLPPRRAPGREPDGQLRGGHGPQPGGPLPDDRHRAPQRHGRVAGRERLGIFVQPLGFFLFLAALIAETKRTPFDQPEGESEIVAGYFLEYSGMKFGMFYMGEYLELLISSAVLVTLFFGRLPAPVPAPRRDHGRLRGTVLFEYKMVHTAVVVICALAFFTKVTIMIFLQIFIRWTLPRFRYDQVMHLGWTKLLPFSLANIMVTGILVLAAKEAGPAASAALKIAGDATQAVVALGALAAFVALVVGLLEPVERKRFLSSTAARFAAAAGGTKAPPRQA